MKGFKLNTPNCSCCKKETKVSSSYPDMWFCKSCGAGDYLKSQRNTIIEIIRSPGHLFKPDIHIEIKTKLDQEQIPSTLLPTPPIGIPTPFGRRPQSSYPESLLKFEDDDKKIISSYHCFLGVIRQFNNLHPRIRDKYLDPLTKRTELGIKTKVFYLDPTAELKINPNISSTNYTQTMMHIINDLSTIKCFLRREKDKIDIDFLKVENIDEIIENISKS